MSTEQEYDAHADMLDEDPSDHSAGPGPYPDNFFQTPAPMSQPMQIGMQSQQSMSMAPPSSHGLDFSGLSYGGMAQTFDPADPMLDADPFGLTASMHFPTQFTFQENSMRGQNHSGL